MDSYIFSLQIVFQMMREFRVKANSSHENALENLV